MKIICDWENCNETGLYKAPVEKDNSKKHRLLCLNHIKIFNKVGLAYGFVLDNAYIIDLKHNIEFFLTAVVYGNENRVLNDNIYDYDTQTIPFLAELGNAIYLYEKGREKKYTADLSYFGRL